MQGRALEPEEQLFSGSLPLWKQIVSHGGLGDLYGVTLSYLSVSTNDAASAIPLALFSDDTV